MKGINIFFILLMLLFFISDVSAVSHTGDVDLQLSVSASDWALQDGHVYGSGISIYAFKYKGVADAGIPNTLVFRDASMGKQAAYAWADIPQNVGGSFALYDNGVFAGTGGITIHRVNDVDAGRVDVWYQFDDSDFVINTSETIMDVTLYGSPIGEYYSQFHLDYYLHPYTTQNVEMQFESGSYHGTHASWLAGASSYVEYDYYGHFINEYNITLSGATASTVITRDGLGQQLSSSRFKLTNSAGSTVYLPSSYSTTNSTHNHDNGSYYYYLDVENYGNVLLYDAITVAGPSVGSIELNQTYYTEPELIQIDAELTIYDFTKSVYFIVLEVSENAGVTWSRIYASYNETSTMSSASKSIIATLNTQDYTLPIKIRAGIKENPFTTETTTIIAYSNEVYYNPPEVYDYIFEGAVFDAGTNAPITGATVSATGATTTSSTTMPTGKFKLYLLKGIYIITGSKSGYVDNVNEDIVIAGDISFYNIYLTQTSYTNGTINGIITDINTGSALQDVHLIFTNDTATIDAYSQATGYYDIGGFAQSSTYNISAVKSGYHTYIGSVTTAATGGATKSFSMVPVTPTPTPTPTIIPTEIPTTPTPLPTTYYPGGEGYEWTNDDIVTMLRVIVPGFFLLMLVFLLLAVMLGISGNNGNGGQGGSGLSELWRRY